MEGPRRRRRRRIISSSPLVSVVGYNPHKITTQYLFNCREILITRWGALLLCAKKWRNKESQEPFQASNNKSIPGSFQARGSTTAKEVAGAGEAATAAGVR